MKISLKADYALNAVEYLANQKPNTRHSINEIAEAKKVPRDFLAKILKELARAGIIKSFQGVHGGYQLAKTSNQITVLAVVEAMNGPLVINLCNTKGGFNNELHLKKCPLCTYFKGLQTQIKKDLGGQTMAQFKR